MNRPDDPYEAASYDLKQFRERRMKDRRLTPRASSDRRCQQGNGNPQGTPQVPQENRDH